MSDLFANISLGLATALTPNNLMFCFLGCFLGTFIGVLPGVGAITAISMLLPMTFYLEPTTALIMMAGIYYGSSYGGSTASILINVPGSPGAAVVCLDGYPMARAGRGGVALLLTALASFFAGSVGIVLMMLFSPMIVDIALQFGPAEYFTLMLLGLVAASAMAGESICKGIAMVVLGIFFGVVGMDMYSGVPRFTFDVASLYEGVSLVALAMGLFGISEVISSARTVKQGEVHAVTLRSMTPTKEDLRRSVKPALRGTGIGAFLGVLPGVGSTIACFISYTVERKLARDPSRFGKGAVEGIVAPEASNNAADQTSFIPTMTLGIPGSATMALILGILAIHGITPGPMLMVHNPSIFWGLVMSFWIGNIMLLILNIPLIGLWVRMLRIPYHYLYPAILMFICIGVFSVNNNPVDIWIAILFGAMGYGLRVLRFPIAPLLLGFVLGPMMEENFIRAMILSQGDLSALVNTPISGSIFGLTMLIMLWGIWGILRRRDPVEA